jgi:hypothetical protein
MLIDRCDRLRLLWLLLLPCLIDHAIWVEDSGFPLLVAVEHLEGWVSVEVKIGRAVRQRIIWQSKFVQAVRVRAILAKSALALLHVVLAFLRLKVVVWDVHHFELHFER